jgi:orotidine-5'-phosphate decarboxylase
MTSGRPGVAGVKCRMSFSPQAGDGAVVLPRDRLIFALDVPGDDEARDLIVRLGDAVSFYKLGLGLLTNAHYFELVDRLGADGRHIFADLKLFDIPATVAAAVAGLRGRGIRFLTVHGDPQIMRAAVDAAGGEIGILAVTVLTSLDAKDLAAMGYARSDVQSLVLAKARQARDAGCAGVIASGREAAAIRADVGTPPTATGAPFRIVTPGIRPSPEAAGTSAEAPLAGAAGDQKRVVTPAHAFRNGADFIVVGRPIRDADDPHAAALSIQRTIAGIFPS